MNRAISRTLLAGTLAGVALCAAATLAYAAGLPFAPRLAHLGVLALFATPPLRLAVTAGVFLSQGEKRLALAATVVLGALLLTAAGAILR